jgi:hypothetical protein
MKIEGGRMMLVVVDPDPGDQELGVSKESSCWIN